MAVKTVFHCDRCGHTSDSDASRYWMSATSNEHDMRLCSRTDPDFENQDVLLCSQQCVVLYVQAFTDRHKHWRNR